MNDDAKVADLADLPPGDMLLVDFEGVGVALANVDGTIYAFDDACTHMGGRLSQGMLEDGAVICPLHRGRFDVATGAVLSPPPTENLACYRVDVNEMGEIRVAAR